MQTYQRCNVSKASLPCMCLGSEKNKKKKPERFNVLLIPSSMQTAPLPVAVLAAAPAPAPVSASSSASAPDSVAFDSARHVAVCYSATYISLGIFICRLPENIARRLTHDKRSRLSGPIWQMPKWHPKNPNQAKEALTTQPFTTLCLKSIHIFIAVM